MALATGALAVAEAEVLAEASHHSLVGIRAGLHATRVRTLEHQPAGCSRTPPEAVLRLYADQIDPAVIVPRT